MAGESGGVRAQRIEAPGRSTLPVLLVALILSSPAASRAESFVTAVGDYYKERSTRVMAPSIAARVELPDEWVVDGKLLVDQITSASGAFTATDEAFTERRYEVSAGARKRFHDLQPGLQVRFSDETDYTSFGVATNFTAFLLDDLAAITGSLAYTHDWVGRRTSDTSSGARQQGADEFADTLRTLFVGLRGTHTINPYTRLGASARVQIFRGFLENVYRREQHPRAREDYTLGGHLQLWVPDTEVGLNFDLCLHASSWGHVAISPQLEVFWDVTRWLRIIPQVRLYAQPVPAFFSQGAERPDPNDPNGDPLIFNTQDPTMFAHNTFQAGARFSFRLSASQGVRIVPAYYFRYQDTQYGNAHIAQVGYFQPPEGIAHAV